MRGSTAHGIAAIAPISAISMRLSARARAQAGSSLHMYMQVMVDFVSRCDSMYDFLAPTTPSTQLVHVLLASKAQGPQACTAGCSLVKDGYSLT